MERQREDLLRTTRTRLLERQRELFVSFLGAERGLQALEAFERGEPELEERAQEDSLAEVLGHLEDRQQRELREIVHALERIRRGAFGRCERCGREIAAARIHAAPAVRYCRACAGELERWPEEGSTEPERAETAPEAIAAEYDGMPEDDLQAAVLEQLRLAGPGYERIEAIVERGGVTLHGEVPTEQHRETAVDLVKDRVGVEVEQDLRVDAFAFPSSGRRPESDLPTEEPEVRRALGTEEQSEDAFEAEKEGRDYSPPDQPVPGPRKA